MAPPVEPRLSNPEPTGTGIRPVVILGAGRHGRQLLDLFREDSIEPVGFLDDTMAPGTHVNGCRVLGGFEHASSDEFVERYGMVVGIGDNDARVTLSQQILASGGTLVSAVHPAAIVSPSAVIGRGVYLGSYARVGPNAQIGDFALVEGLTTLGTDTVVGTGAFVGAGCQFTAATRVGARAMVGTGALIIDGHRVGGGSVIGAGAVVTADIPAQVVAVGVPAAVVRHLGPGSRRPRLPQSPR